MKKKKVMLVGETSFLPTGLARYNKEILMRLHASNKYELTEFGYYADDEDSRIDMIPWRYYNNKPAERNVAEMKQYNSDLINQFGKYRFDQVLFDVKPDVVITSADYWYFDWIESSPHRRFYKLVVMPTVDSIPQHENWLACYRNFDVVLPYTQFAKRALSSLENIWGEVAYAGVELDIYRPMDKSKVRSEFGIEDDTILIGTTMRCQARKLFPELFEAFAKYLQVGPKELTKKSLLHVHSTMPDLGWSFAHLIKKYNLSSKILFTYVCRNCGAVFPAFFRDIRTTCEICKTSSAYFPNTQHGVSRENLAKIFNCFDVYTQYANSEGFGLGQAEAAACGIPVFSTDYSAMSEISRMVGYPIKVSHYKTDVDFNTERATPDADDFIAKLISYLLKTDSEKERLSRKYREVAVKNFNWDSVAAVWMNAIDSVEVPGHEYHESPALHEPIMPTQPFEDNADFVRWCIINVLGKPEMVNSYMAMRMIRDLNSGCTPIGVAGSTYHNESSGLGLNNNHDVFTPEIAINKLVQMRELINNAEINRYETIRGRQASPAKQIS